MNFQEIKDQDQSYILHTYGRVDAALVKGKNARAWDVEGKEYIDFTAGIGVNALGYSDPEWVAAVAEQAGRDGIPYLTATHDVNNPRSGAVMQAVGMQYQYSYEELVQPKGELVTFRLYQKNLDGAEGRVFRRYWDLSKVHFIESF